MAGTNAVAVMPMSECTGLEYLPISARLVVIEPPVGSNRCSRGTTRAFKDGDGSQSSRT